MIIILTQCFPSRIGGIESLVGNLALGISKKEKIIVFADQHNIAEDTLYDNNIKNFFLVNRTKGIKFFRKRKKVRELNQFLLSNKIKCIIGDSWKSFELSIDLINKEKIPTLCLAHGNELIKKNDMQFQRLKKTLSNVTSIIANSDYTAGLIEKLDLKKPSIKKIYPGAVNYTSYNEEFVSNISGNPILLTLARLEKRKGHEEILNSISKLKLIFPKIQYLVAGDGPELENLKNIVKKLDIIDNVIFLGNINDSQKKYIFDRTSLMVMPTLDNTITRSIEGFGISYIEAAFFGIPSIASNVGGTSEAVINNLTGKIIMNIGDLYIEINKLLSDKLILAKLGANAKLRAQQEFSWENITSQYIKIINNVNENKKI